MKTNVICTLSLLLMSACVDGADTPTMDMPQTARAGFVTVGPFGQIDSTLTQTIAGDEVEGDGDGYGYVVGLSPVGPSGIAGLTAATDLRDNMVGRTQMRGVYRVGQIDDMQPEQLGMTFTLAADFDAGTLIGHQGDLVVKGTISGHILQGTVTYHGLRGTLTGQIDGDRAVGAFVGNDADTAFAGGFVINR